MKAEFVQCLWVLGVVYLFSAFFSLSLSFCIYRIILIRQHKLYTGVEFFSSVLRKQEYGHLTLCNGESTRKAHHLFVAPAMIFSVIFFWSIHPPSHKYIFEFFCRETCQPVSYLACPFRFAIHPAVSYLCFAALARLPLLNCPSNKKKKKNP